MWYFFMRAANNNLPLYSNSRKYIYLYVPEILKMLFLLLSYRFMKPATLLVL